MLTLLPEPASTVETVEAPSLIKWGFPIAAKPTVHTIVLPATTAVPGNRCPW